MSITIKTAAITDRNKVEFLELSTPDLQHDEVLVKVRAVALCTLEQRIFAGKVKMPLPCTGGHEVAGEIADLGEGVNPGKWAAGDRVCVRMLYNCGECHYCRSGRTNLCEYSLKKPVREGLLVGPGGLCDYIIVKTNALYKIPDSLSYEEGSLTEPLACCIHSVERAHLQLAENVVVIGGGIMGQYHVMLARLRGCRVIMSEVDPARRELAKTLGANYVINPLETDPVEFVHKLCDGRGADAVFNTTAIPGAVQQAIALAGKRGRMIQYSSMHPDAPIPVSPQLLHSSEMILTGSISPDVKDFYTANRLLSYGMIDCKPLINSIFAFEEAQQAFEEAVIPGKFRVIITN